MKVDPCLKCGTPMYRGTTCPDCGAPDRLGRVSEISKNLAILIFCILLVGFFAIVAVSALSAMLSG